MPCSMNYESIIKITSTLTLFRILPVGVESKKDIGARMMQSSMFLKSFSDVSRPTSDTSKDRIKTHNAHPMDSAMYIKKRRPKSTLDVVVEVGGDPHAIQ